MTPEVSRVARLVATTAALALVVGVLIESIFFKGGGPEGAIVTRLKHFEVDGLRIELDAGVLVSQKLSYQRISVVLDAAGETAEVTSTLDFVGQLQRPLPTPATQVSSLGLERARYVNRAGSWVPEGSDAPRLVRIVETLETRRSGLERGAPLEDGGVPWPEVQQPRTYRSEAWFVRSERGEVEVAEDFRLMGTSPQRPVDDRATRRLTLQETDGGSFSFPGGIL